ncbi:15413_t:CDS:2 [Entrophospora sp. SA101]|nr:15413_t:CDS:2 [Entrophospora sp. SA101]CAJ0848603.1 3999_t:CDS:2 [Entrophospora sp. SA101]
MVNAQEYLNSNYPKEERESITKLELNNRELEGHLDLSDFTKLEELYCYDNQLTSLVISNCSKLITLDCSTNELTTLDLSKNLELKNLNCYSNKLEESVFCLPSNKEKLNSIVLFNNNFSGDLAIFREYVNLNLLNLKKNRFTGSLEYLKSLNELKDLYIDDNADINLGLEYLPDSIERFSCKVFEVFNDSFVSKIGKIFNKLNELKISYSKEEDGLKDGEIIIIKHEKSVEFRTFQTKEEHLKLNEYPNLEKLIINERRGQKLLNDIDLDKYIKGVNRKDWRVIYVSENHPEIKRLLRERKLQEKKQFTVRYGKPDKEENNF